MRNLIYTSLVLIVYGACLLIISGVFSQLRAQTRVTGWDEASAIALCTNVGDVAASVMALRQDGMSVSSLMKMQAQHQDGRALVLRAFTVPVQSDADQRKKAVDTFRESVEAPCFVAFFGAIDLNKPYLPSVIIPSGAPPAPEKPKGRKVGPAPFHNVEFSL